MYFCGRNFFGLIHLGGGSPSFEHLLVPFPKEGESEAWAGDSGKKLGKGDR